ncbi:MAG: hypothetical protein CL608_18295 [Anaerolineaceae bacterium]|nr:hypothetical protein [Anaerolineaceae bacterium]
MIGAMSSFLQRLRPFPFRHFSLWALFLFVMALLPRLAALGQYITPDELNWIHRSVLFHQALGQGKWAETLTTGHPGVITTWLGALGIQVQLWLRPSDITAYEWITHLAWLAPENTAAFPQLATFLSAGRVAVAVMNSLGLIFIFWLARKLVDFWLAAGFVLLLALDPFVAGLSGLLHVDGLMTTFTTISLLALAVVFADGENGDWRLTAVSGAAAGCAILTKSAALTLLPFVALAFAVGLIVRRGRWRKLVVLGLVWLVAMLGVQFLLLPALWSSPVGTYETIISTIFHETEEVLPRTFFMGVYRQAHGPGFYLAALLYRLNPVVFLGLLLGGWFALRRKWTEGWWQRPTLWLAISWPIFFMVVLSFATKKYDRYLLPALPFLFLLGVLGWGLLLRQRPSWKQTVTIGGAVVMLVYLGTAVPYLLNAYNPLVGGTFAAKYVMPMGWGEAVSASAQWLAEQPGAAEKTAVAGIGPAFAPYFPGETILRKGDNWREADFVVESVTGNQLLDPEPLRSGWKLLHTVHFDGRDQAWIFANDNPREPDVVWEEQAVQFGEQIRVLAAGTAVQDNQLNVFVQWQLVQPANGRFNVQLRLLDENGQPWAQMEMPLLNEVYFYPEHWQPDEQPVWQYELALPPGLPPATYRVELSMFAAEGGAQLPVFGEDGRFTGVVQPLTELKLSPPSLLRPEQLGLTSEPEPLLSGDLLLLGQTNLPENVLMAGNFTFDLFWQGTAVLPENLQLQFSANDVLLAALPLSQFDSGQWQVEQVLHEKYRLPVPADLVVGEYDLRVEVVAGNGRSLSAPLDLGTITVVSPDRLFTLPDDLAQPLALQFGDLASLRGYDLLTPSAAPGESVRLTLYWQVNRQPDEIYSTFVHLIGPDGQIVEQGDQWPGGLPSNTWAAGQVIIDEYAIQLPENAPTGTYQIVLGLYAPASGVRLPVAAEDGAMLSDDQFVLPLPLEVIAR